MIKGKLTIDRFTFGSGGEAPIELADAGSSAHRYLCSCGQLLTSSGHRAPVGQPAIDDPERIEARLRRVPRQHQPGPDMRRLENPIEPPQDHAQPACSPAQPGGALVELSGSCLSHLRLDMRHKQLSRVAATDEHPQSLVQAPAVEVRVEIAEAG